MGELEAGVNNSSRLGSTPAFTSTIPLDLVEISYYDKMVDELVSVSSINGPLYMREFLKAKDIAARYHSLAVYEADKAKEKAAKFRAIAMLDKAPAALTEKGVRVNEEFCKKFADLDIDYLNAREEERYWEALSSFLFNKVMKFQNAHDDAKKIYDQTRQSAAPLTAMSSGRDT